MSAKLTHVGFNNYLAVDKIVAVATPSSSPIKRRIQDARDKGLIIDLTNGRRTKSVIFISSQHLALSSLEPVTINGRIASEV